MKVFIAYDMKENEDRKELLATLELISNALHAAGVESFSAHVQHDDGPSGDTIKAALEKIDHCDAVLAFIQSDDVSESMVLEIGYSYIRKPIHVFHKQNITLASYELADSVTPWENLDQIEHLIKERFA
jgi:nucleoside 2-deoxyribosyltransferase